MSHTPTDVANYVYCPKAWERIRGQTNEAARVEGIQQHELRNKKLLRVRDLQDQANRLGMITLLSLLTGLAVHMGWLAFPTLPTPIRHVLLAVSIIAAVATLGLGLRYVRADRAANDAALKLNLADGAVNSVDENIHYYASTKHGLIGIPDTTQRTPSGEIPVEFKGRLTSRNGPWENHRLQVAAYNLLLEENTGSPPPYGILQYEDKSYHIPNDAAHRQKLIETLERMNNHLHRGLPVRRVHNNPVKCRACAHRLGCSDRLA